MNKNDILIILGLPLVIPAFLFMVFVAFIIDLKNGLLFYNPRNGCKVCKGKMDEHGFPESDHIWECKKCGWTLKDGAKYMF